MPFTEFISLLKASAYLISDGGSNQEECSYLGKPCLLLREATERKEGLESCCVLSRFETSVIERFLADPEKYATREVYQPNSPSLAILQALTNS
jgi:UDP-N-acetylglucosamine 2-epimerase (non-hydrolysing)